MGFTGSRGTLSPSHGERHHERIELTFEVCAAERDATEQCLGVSHCRRAGKDSCRGDLTSDPLQGLLAQRSRQDVQYAAQR